MSSSGADGADGADGVSDIVDDILVQRRKIQEAKFTQGRGPLLRERRILYGVAAGLALTLAGLLVWIALRMFETHPPRSCSGTAPCPSGQTCVAGACVRARLCKADADCSSSSGGCVAGLCQPKSCKASRGCASHATLGGGAVYCDSGRCRAGCAADGDCSSGQECVVSHNANTGERTLPGHCAMKQCAGGVGDEQLWSSLGLDADNPQACGSDARCSTLDGAKGDLATPKGRCYAASACVRAKASELGVDSPHFCTATMGGACSDSKCSRILGVPAVCGGGGGTCVPVPPPHTDDA